MLKELGVKGVRGFGITEPKFRDRAIAVGWSKVKKHSIRYEIN